MTRHNILTTAVIAVATALITLILALPTQLNAVDTSAKPKPENKTPALVVNGVNMSLKLVSHGDAKTGPVLQLLAVNKGNANATLHCAVAMLDRDEASGGERSEPAENTIYTHNQPINIGPGKTLAYTIHVTKRAAAGHAVSFALSSGKESIRVAGFSVPAQVAMASPQGR